MAFLKDSTNRLLFLLLCLCGAAGTAAAFFLHFAAGFAALGTALAMVATAAVFAGRRHRAVDELVQYLDRVLRGDYALDAMGNEEGELKVLKSELYKMTVALREQADALQADKLYLADAMADISHQLRTPLTSIHLTLTLLSQEDCPPEQRRALLRELTVLLSQMDSLIAALLKLSKLDAGTVTLQKERLPVARLLEKAAQPLLIPLELRGQQIRFLGDGNAALSGDEMWTVEAFCNILKNCMEHMEEGGEITVKAEENALYTQIIVLDNGRGIDKEDLPHIFERFYRGKHDGGAGFGIGLALSRMIITSQNGTIKAANNPEGGSRFIIRFYKAVI